MSNTLLMGVWQYIIPIPQKLWQKHIPQLAKKMEDEHGFMTEDHRRIHHFVVRELPRIGEPLSPEFIARELGFTKARVTAILDDLERNMTFLFRNNGEAVVWAYPVTVEKTPHHVTFNTGEQLYAA
jgi:hypothetical protein